MSNICLRQPPQSPSVTLLTEIEQSVMGKSNRRAPVELTAVPSAKRAKRSQPRKQGPHNGRLSKFVEMPMDIIFEISLQLHPLDLLRLSRVSKVFRSIYMSQPARAIWRSTLKDFVPELPPCPRDLNEAQYASLLFESSCSACGYAKATKSYSLRITLCKSCWSENTMNGYAWRKMGNPMPDVIYSLIPRHMNYERPPPIILSNPHYSNLDSRSNNIRHEYYRPEFEMVVSRYISLRSRKRKLEAFIAEQQGLSTNMMQSGSELHSWSLSYQRHQTILTSEREDSIERKLKELGWHDDDFPKSTDRSESAKWVKLADKPEPLTVEAWNDMLPKLESIVLRCKDKRLYEARDDQVKSKYWYELQNLYHSGVVAMPHWPEARKLRSIANVLERYWEDLPGDLAFWPSVFSGAVVDAEQYKIAVMKDFVKLLRRANPWLFPSKKSLGDILNCVSCVFQCANAQCRYSPSTYYCNQIYGYPEILQHMFIRDFRNSWSIDGVECDKDIARIVLLMLGNLNIAVDAPRSTIEDLNSKSFVCLCGHPSHLQPTSFYALVDHVKKENDWYTKAKNSEHSHNATKARNPIRLLNDHDMKGTTPVIAMASPNLKTPSKLAVSRIDIERLLDVCYCRPCYKMSLGSLKTKFETAEDVLYHMEAKHHIGIVGVGHLDTEANLIQSIRRLQRGQQRRS